MDSQDSNEEITRQTELRPWGSFSTIDEVLDCRMKMVHIKPGHRQSLQSHFYRSKHIVLFGGILKITRGEDSIMLAAGQSVYIPKLVIHRIENPGMVPSVFLLVETGEYLGEEDIKRYDDDYAR